MAKVLIVYYSRTGNTKQMAKLVEEGIKAEGMDVETKDVQDVKTNELLNADGIINLVEFAYIAAEWLTDTTPVMGDLTGDGYVNTDDLSELEIFWLESCLEAP